MPSKRACTCGKYRYCNSTDCGYSFNIKKRGSSDRRVGRFGRLEPINIQEFERNQSILQTVVKSIESKSIISSNQSPDIPWSKTINPYIGCEHGCVYCYARPTHAYHDLSPGLDFESKLFAKTNAAELLRLALSKTNYIPSTIGLGTNTDAYQPIERKYGITRQILDVLREFKHPVSVLTKNSLIERDLDILTDLAKDNLVEVHFTVTSLDHELSRILEPRASLPKARLETIAKLSHAGIPVKVMFSPVIPGLNDSEMEPIMIAAKKAGATSMGYILLRLPYEVHGLFTDWLEQYFPDKKPTILNQVEEFIGDFSFKTRMTGNGLLAQTLSNNFNRLFNELNFKIISPDDLDHCKFTRQFGSKQLELF